MLLLALVLWWLICVAFAWSFSDDRVALTGSLVLWWSSCWYVISLFLLLIVVLNSMPMTTTWVWYLYEFESLDFIRINSILSWFSIAWCVRFSWYNYNLDAHGFDCVAFDFLDSHGNYFPLFHCWLFSKTNIFVEFSDLTLASYFRKFWLRLLLWITSAIEFVQLEIGLWREFLDVDYCLLLV